jgi:SAM-dependent methyltransferase
MPLSASVDYAEIRDDFEFFLAHSTETAAQIGAFAPHMAWLAGRPTPARMLDFGCGAGIFTERLLRAVGPSPEHLALVLVEPVSEQLQEAARRLGPLASCVMAAGPDARGAAADRFDLIIANHSLYYVAEPAATTAALLERLAPGGRLIAALLDHGNALAGIWKAGFAAADMRFPFMLAEQFEAILDRLGCAIGREAISYKIAFPDRDDAKRRIVRFLLGADSERLSSTQVNVLFEPYRHADLVLIETTYPHLVAEQAGEGESLPRHES